MITLNYRDARPIYEQIRDSLRQRILSGIMVSGEKLPSVRSLAAELAINPNTIQRAYSALEAEGFLCSIPGKGSFVAELPEHTAQKALLEEGRLLCRKLCAHGCTREQWMRLYDEEVEQI